MSREPPVPPQVLVVEDELRVARLMADVLEAEGYEVDTAANGLLALAKIEAHAYDLILCDLRMPELDGHGLYRELERRQTGFSTLVPQGFIAKGFELLKEAVPHALASAARVYLFVHS